MSYNSRLEEAVKQAESASEIARQWANGPANATIETESGPLPTMAEFLRLKGSEIDQNAGNIAAFKDQLADENSTAIIAGKQAATLASTQVIIDSVNEHNSSSAAHPELMAEVELAANRAEAAADAALTNGKIYATAAAGQSDSALAVGAYFWVQASAVESVLELWTKGASSPVDTSKRMVDYNYVRNSGTEDMSSDFPFAIVGEDNGRTWLEMDEFGDPTDYSAEKIANKLPIIQAMPFPDANEQAFAIVGEDGSRCWLEADETGKPTEYAIEKLIEVLPEAAELETIEEPELNPQGFAIVGEDGTRTWLEADENGKPTDYALEKITEGLPSADAGFYIDATGKKHRVSSGPNIVAWGDSMTAGATGVPYTDYLQTMLAADGKTNQVFNMGVGGESSITIAARANGTPFTATVTGGVIPASGRVGIKLLPINGVKPEPIRQSGNFVCTFAGITGTFGVDYNGGAYDYWFERSIAGSTITADRPETIYLNIGEERNEDIAIIWIGQNQPNWVDGNNSNSTRNNERAILDAKAIIRHLSALDKRYLVISKPSGDTSTNVEDARWYDEFDQRFIAIRQYMVTPIYAGDGTTIVSCYGLQDAGIVATPQDITEISEGRIPASLRNDSVHWKAAGYEVLAKVIYKKLKQLGWI